MATLRRVLCRRPSRIQFRPQFHQHRVQQRVHQLLVQRGRLQHVDQVRQFGVDAAEPLARLSPAFRQLRVAGRVRVLFAIEEVV